MYINIDSYKQTNGKKQTKQTKKQTYVFVQRGLRDEAMRTNITREKVLLVLPLHVFLMFLKSGELSATDRAGETASWPFTRAL